MRKAVTIFCNILAYAIIIAIILFAGGIVLARALEYPPMTVLSDSMYPSYRVGDLVIIDTKSSQEELAIGDIITYDSNRREGGDPVYVSHRLVGFTEDGRFLTKGDFNPINDPAVARERYFGKVIFKIPKAGRLIRDLPTKRGIGYTMTTLAVLIVLFVVPVLLKPLEPPKNASAENVSAAEIKEGDDDEIS